MTSDDGLARVSYLPGVLPPTPSSDSAEVDHAEPDHAGPDRIGFYRTEPAAPSPDADHGAEQDRAEKLSMHALTRRGQSRWEIEQLLLGRDIDEHTAANELDRLERVGLIDDAELADTLVRTQHERKGLGRSALSAELRRRHIDQTHIDNALTQVDDDDEQTRANELALRRAPQLHSLDQETAKRRLTGFLMRKGYAGSVVRAAVDEALSTNGRSSGVRFR